MASTRPAASRTYNVDHAATLTTRRRPPTAPRRREAPTHRPRRRRTLAAILAAGALILAGCGAAGADPRNPQVRIDFRKATGVEAVAVQLTAEGAYWHGIGLLHLRAESDRLAAEEAARQAAAAARASRPSGGSRGGSCTPEGIAQAESGGSYTARNPTSTASGKYQFLDSTWAGYGGYASAADAPPEVQEAKFQETWAGGAGASHWAASVC